MCCLCYVVCCASCGVCCSLRVVCWGFDVLVVCCLLCIACVLCFGSCRLSVVDYCALFEGLLHACCCSLFRQCCWLIVVDCAAFVVCRLLFGVSCFGVRWSVCVVYGWSFAACCM